MDKTIPQKERVNCKKCLMPFEERFINKQGECVICDEHRKKWLNRDYAEKEKELKLIFEHYKQRNKDHKYDSIVAFSGGKDSVYALYLVTKKYGMRPLVVTADNGLLTPMAVANMNKVIDQFGVDHIVVTRDPEELKSIYRAYFQKTKNFCEICYLTIHSALGQAALEHDVPLIITGFAFKVDSSHFRAAHRYCFEDSFAKIVKDSIPAEIYEKYVTKQARAENQFHLLHLFDYINHVDKEIYHVLENELNWDSNRREDKHMDCRFHHMLGYLRLINNDLTSLALMTPAALLRDGQITVEQFHEQLAKEKALFKDVDREQIEEFLDFFGVNEEFLKAQLDVPQLAEPLVSESEIDSLIQSKRQAGADEPVLIELLLDSIRPELKRDGGDIRILSFNDRLLKIELLGACRACTIADQVMMRYLEHLIRSYISEDIILENVKPLAPISL